MAREGRSGVVLQLRIQWWTEADGRTWFEGLQGQGLGGGEQRSGGKRRGPWVRGVCVLEERPGGPISNAVIGAPLFFSPTLIRAILVQARDEDKPHTSTHYKYLMMYLSWLEYSLGALHFTAHSLLSQTPLFSQCPWDP